MVSALDSGASGPGSSPGRGHCVVFLGKTAYSQGPGMDKHPVQGRYATETGISSGSYKHKR